MYTAYVLTDESREALQEKFPPKYSEFIGHHVTVDFGLPSDAALPEEAHVRVLGMKDSTDGLEALVVTVNGESKRPDGNLYHITWSLDREKYKPHDSNNVIANAISKYTVSLPVYIETTPDLLK